MIDVHCTGFTFMIDLQSQKTGKSIKYRRIMLFYEKYTLRLQIGICYVPLMDVFSTPNISLDEDSTLSTRMIRVWRIFSHGNSSLQFCLFHELLTW